MARNTRIDKLFSTLGIMSRSECKKAVKQGKIALNGVICRSTDEKCDPDADQITLDGETVDTRTIVYYMMNKPAGVITASEDPRCETVMDYVDDGRADLAPVGRLDKDTTGFLLITNDGQLNHRLLSPRYHVPKTYRVLIDGVLTDEDIRRLERGVDIGDDKPTLPAKVEIPEVQSFPFRAPDSMYPEADMHKAKTEETGTRMTRTEETDARMTRTEETDARMTRTEETDTRLTQTEKNGTRLTQAEESGIQVPGAEKTGAQVVLLTITEGRFHQVKRMFEAVGKPVIRLHRQSFGPLDLDPSLPEGEIRELTAKELQALMDCTSQII